MGRPFIRKGDVGNAFDGLPSFGVELTAEPDGVFQIRVYGARDAALQVDDEARATSLEIRDRLNHPDNGEF